MVFAPRAVMFSMAAIWDAVSPSFLPDAVNNFAPIFFASAVAPSFILTKKGLVSVLVIRPITGSLAAKAPEAAKANADKIRGADFFIQVSSVNMTLMVRTPEKDPGELRTGFGVVRL